MKMSPQITEKEQTYLLTIFFQTMNFWSLVHE